MPTHRCDDVAASAPSRGSAASSSSAVSLCRYVFLFSCYGVSTGGVYPVVSTRSRSSSAGTRARPADPSPPHPLDACRPLARTHTQRFAVPSHSNGLFYALYALLYLPPTLTATSWTLHGPFVPPSISGSASLRLAAALPAPLPNALGALMQLAPPPRAHGELE
ncbi:hypothetical protein DFH09DRAFT_1305962 [Mycena vulgaris]|nr:hypothetical protein DFH09DRAFT_1305962 [Mycena vulgaris]